MNHFVSYQTLCVAISTYRTILTTVLYTVCLDFYASSIRWPNAFKKKTVWNVFGSTCQSSFVSLAMKRLHFFLIYYLLVFPIICGSNQEVDRALFETSNTSNAMCTGRLVITEPNGRQQGYVSIIYLYYTSCNSRSHKYVIRDLCITFSHKDNYDKTQSKDSEKGNYSAFWILLCETVL